MVHGATYQPERGGNTGAERHAVEAGSEDVGHRIPGRGERPVPGFAEGDYRGRGLDVRGRKSEAQRGEAGIGVNQDDGAGNTIAERVRAATAGLFEKAGRVGSAFGELRQMYGNTREDNAKLSREVVALSSRVAHLSEQVRRLSR